MALDLAHGYELMRAADLIDPERHKLIITSVPHLHAGTWAVLARVAVVDRDFCLQPLHEGGFRHLGYRDYCAGVECTDPTDEQWLELLQLAFVEYSQSVTVGHRKLAAPWN